MNPPLDPPIKEALATLPLSTLQREVWLDQALFPDVPLYNTGAYARIAGSVDVSIFERALEHVIARHDALRIVLVPADELPMQRILHHVSPNLQYIDFSAQTDADTRARQWLRDTAVEPFTLLNASLFRFALLKVADDCYYWLTQYHHTLVDGWTEIFIVQEVADAYNLLLAGQDLPEHPAPSYIDFVADEQAYIASEQFRTDESYWKNVYREIPESLFHRRHDVAPSAAHRSHEAEIFLDESCCAVVREFAREHRVSLSQIFLGVLYGYFARTMGRDDVAFGLFSRNRRTVAFEQTAGLFVSTYSVWYRLGTNLNFLELLQGIGDEARRGAPHRRFPLSDLMRTIGLLGTERARPFDVTVSFLAGQCHARFGNAPVELLTLSNGFQPHGLVIYIEDMHAPGRIRWLFDGNCTLFSENELRRLAEGIESFLAAAIRRPDLPIAQLPLMPDPQKAAVLVSSFGKQIVRLDESPCVHEAIAARAVMSPHAIAVEFDGERLTYAELNTRANHWAFHLQNLPVFGDGPEVFVGCCIERSLDMIIAMLAIWKAGGVYVPLDPEYPPDRLATMISGARVSVLLTESRLRDRLPACNALTIIDTDAFRPDKRIISNPATRVEPDNAAYVIFTSGSSGAPKGVVVTHANLHHLALRLSDLFAIHPNDRILQFTNPGWDTSFEEIVPCLMAGSQLVLRTPEMVDPRVFLSACATQRISIVDIPTVFFHELVSVLAMTSVAFPESIHTVVIGGEAVNSHKAAEFLALAHDRVRLVNTFGATEATAVSTSFDLRAPLVQVPIGIPIPNVNVYLLDRQFEPMPLDFIGELFIGGAGVARGYMNRPALTAERFLPDPLSPIPGARMYRTGDLAERREDGAILFHGRRDQQIKIWGMRVERGEIEAVLARHDSIREIIVENRTTSSGTERLIAYVIASTGHAAKADAIRRYARERLPTHMIPEAFVFLDEWPRLHTGKINRRALPEPTTPLHSVNVETSSPVEEIVAHAFVEILGIARVGPNDDFFSLGGNSLLAMRLVSRLQSRLGFAPPMARVFQSPTVRALSSFIIAIDGQTDIIRPVSRARGEVPFDGLSSMERRLWFLERLYPDDHAYQAPHAFRFRGELDENALRTSLEALAERHEILRTTYPQRDGEPIRYVSTAVNIPMRFRDLSLIPEMEKSSMFRQLVADEIATPFDLDNGPLTRLLVLRIANDEHILLLNQHHLITDEWTGGVLLREWSLLYDAAQSGREIALPPVLYQYAEFARAERVALAGEGFSPSRDYWRQQLKDIPHLDIPWLHVATLPGLEARTSIRISPEACQSLRLFARTHGCTVFMVWYAVVLVLFSRHSGQTDFGLGSIAANRDLEATTDLLGLFANRIILRTDLTNDPSFLEIVHRARKTAIDAYRHQALPFDIVVQDQGVVRRLGEMPLYDVSFFQVTMPSPSATSPWTHFFDIWPDGATTAKNALSIALLQQDDTTDIHIAHDVSRIDVRAIRRLLGHLQTVVTDALRFPSKRLSQLNLLTPTEVEWFAAQNPMSRANPNPVCIHELFECQVARHPEAIAIECGETQLTYGELNARANGLAHHLRTRGVHAEVRVGLCVERSLDMVVGILGIWKAGGAYVPLDPVLPGERIARLVEDAAIPIVVTQRRWTDRLPATPATLVLDHSIVEGPGSNLPPLPTSTKHAAYVLFTSGSTGKPKGVVVEHQQVVDYVVGIAQRWDLGPNLRYGLISTFSADLGNTTLFPPLALGGTLRIITDEHAVHPEKLALEFEQHPLDILKIAPSHLAALLTANRPERVLPRKRLVLGGEALHWDLVDTVVRLVPDCTVTNHYGPTETTIGVLTLDVTPSSRSNHSPGPALGKPRAHARAYVLDASLSPVPVDVHGELYIGGCAVTRGYLDVYGLTAERFVPDPFASEPGARMYRTGDVVRWNDDENIEFIGRRDDQIKIRGFRVELGEIEATLRKHPLVRACAVLACEDVPGDKRLVAYVVPNHDPGNVDVLREYLRTKLPDYMVPNTFVHLESLPLTSNGKIDRKSLPTTRVAPHDQRSYVPPQNDLEKAMVVVWEEVLRVKPIGATDDFFALGGHSLLAVRLMATLVKSLGIAPPMATLFQHSTLRTFVAAMTRMQTHESTMERLRLIRRAPGEPAYTGLSSTERRLWFLHRLHPGALSYQEPIALRKHGEFDLATLQITLDALVWRHEILRTAYPAVDGLPTRVIANDAKPSIRFFDVAGMPVGARRATVRQIVGDEVATAFDIENGPLLRTVCIRETSAQHLVIVHRHHLITDGWSDGLLMRELIAVYDNMHHKEALKLPPLPYQFADFARVENMALERGTFAASRTYWKEKLSKLPRISWPILRPSTDGIPGPEGHITCRLSRNMTEQLARLARQHECTSFMAWYAFFAALLSRYAPESHFGIGTVVVNRDTPGTAGLLGFFTNTVVLAMDLSADPTVEQLFALARQTTTAAYRHQALPFDVVVQDHGFSGQSSVAPLFEMSLFEVAAPPRLESTSWTIVREDASDISLDGVRSAKDAVSLALEHDDDGTTLSVYFDTNRVEHHVMERLLNHLTTMVVDAIAHPDKRLSQLFIFSPEEIERFRAWNDTAADYPVAACMHELIEEQARKTPNAVAIVYGSQSLTYRELDERAHRIAHHLQSLGVKPDVLVGLCVERTSDMIVAMLAIFKAGGAYVPLDPAAPDPRMQFFLEDTGTKIIIAQQHLASRVHALGGSTVQVLTLPEHPFATPTNNFDSRVRPHHLAYVVYTSGSTGEPKGVMIEHHSLVAHVSAYVQFHRLTSTDRILALTPPHFDASVEQIFPALTCGAAVVVADWDFDPESFSRRLIEFGVTLLDTSGAHWRALVDTWLEQPGLAEQLCLRTMIVGGDVMPAEVLSQWRTTSLAGRTRLVNVYGPTETTVAATAYEVPNDFDVRLSRIPIGKPYANRTAFVLDRHLRPVPVGIPGELFLGGTGPARGYLNQPQLTAERFLDLAALPFACELPLGPRIGRLYRTGDLCSWLPDGSLDFLGRADNQVKIRGYRVELGEIEAQLRRLPYVIDAVALVHHHGLHKSLRAYVVTTLHADSELESILANSLRQTLPEHMIPASFIVVPEIPRSTTTGKIDRTQLPEPTLSIDKDRVAARTPTEKVIANIFQILLQKDAIAMNDDFFELGGHSLLAARLISRISRAFALQLPLHTVFEQRSVARLAALVDRNLAAATLPKLLPAIRQVSREKPLALSFAQERLWFLDRLGKGTAFHVPLSLRIEGPLDVAALEWSLSEIVQRHESLRTTFVIRDDEPRQVLHSPAKFTLPVVDLRHLSAVDREIELERYIRDEAESPFALASDPMLRARLLWLADEPRPIYTFLCTIHHIASDGWSLDVLARELSALYQSFVDKCPSPLPELPLQIADFAVWQRETLTAQYLAPHFAYWKKQLDGAPIFLQWPTHTTRLSAAGNRGTSSFRIDPEIVGPLRALALRTGTTIFMVALAAFHVLLARWTNQDDIVVGTPVHGRNHEHLEGLLGFFVNNLPIRTNLSDGPSFIDLLRRVRQLVHEALEHQELPFEKLVEHLAPERSTTHHPIFQVVLALRETLEEKISLPGLQISPVQMPPGLARLDLEMHLELRDGGLDGLIHYDTALFDAGTVHTFSTRFCVLLENIVANPQQRIFELPCVLDVERQRILGEWNGIATICPDDFCAHQFIVAQAAQTPEAIAVLFDDGQRQLTLTYSELIQRAAQLAHHLLRAQRLGPEKLVGLCLEPSLERIVGLLGILMAGAAYLPLDPTYPHQRLEFMLHETQPEVIVTQTKFVATFAAVDAAFVCLDRDASTIDAMPTHVPPASVHPDNLAYVIYTSGSTGQPKGVLISHRGLVNVVDAQRKWFRFGSGAWSEEHQRRPEAPNVQTEDRVLHWASLSFDSATAEIFMALASGATLCLAPREQVLPGEPLLRFLERNRISMVTLTPSALANLPFAELPALHTLAVAGEACPSALVHTWARGRRFFNLYGPTEATIWSTAMSLEDPSDATVIGRPIQNTQVYVLDRHGQLTPPETPGELYLGGIGLARGYWKRAALNAIKFVPNPFGPGRLYRTGDLVRWRADGTLQFLGRTDEQVKIRGFRIELGEIESALATHPRVREAVVLVRDDKLGDPRLVAYVVPIVPDESLWPTLRTHIRYVLPEFMIPAAGVILNELPRSPNGKIDRRALPDPAYAAAGHTGTKSPRTTTEKVLVDIWCTVLGIDSVGIEESFFEVGGHSLLLAKVAARVQRAFTLDLPLTAFFERPTIASFARFLDTIPTNSAQTPHAPLLRPMPRNGPSPLSLAQERVWILHEREGQRTAYNMPMAVRLSGPLDVRAVEQSFVDLVRRHEILRINIVLVNNQPMQSVREPDFRLGIVDLRPICKDEQSATVQRLALADATRPFDLALDPLFRVTILRLEDETDHILLINMHHIVSDGWSIGTLMHEFALLYQAHSCGDVATLPPLPIQYIDYAIWQRAWLSPSRLAVQIAYWRDKLSGASSPLRTLETLPRAVQPSPRGQTATRIVPERLASRVRSWAKQHDTTLFITLLAAFESVLARVSGQSDIVVGTPVAYRPRVELEGVCGRFLSILIVRTLVSSQWSFGELVHHVRSAVLDALPHQDITAGKLESLLYPIGDSNSNPIVHVLFNMIPPVNVQGRLPGLTVSDVDVLGEESPKFDLTLYVAECGGDIRLRIVYKADLFAPDTIERLLDAFSLVLLQVSADLLQEADA